MIGVFSLGYFYLYLQGFLKQCCNFYWTVYFTEITWRDPTFLYKKPLSLMSLEFALPSNSVTIGGKIIKNTHNVYLSPRI